MNEADFRTRRKGYIRDYGPAAADAAERPSRGYHYTAGDSRLKALETEGRTMIAAMARVLGCTGEELMSSSRVFPLPTCRGIVMQALWERGYSWLQIEKAFSIDHSTMIHNRNRAKELIEVGDREITDIMFQFQTIINL